MSLQNFNISKNFFLESVYSILRAFKVNNKFFRLIFILNQIQISSGCTVTKTGGNLSKYSQEPYNYFFNLAGVSVIVGFKEQDIILFLFDLE